MHVLNKILIEVPVDKDTRNRNLAITCQTIADDSISGYAGQVFEYHSTVDAGMFSARYPSNVIFASENLAAVIEEIEDSRAEQESYIKYYAESIGMDRTIGSIIRDTTQQHPSIAYCLLALSRLLSGTYSYESGFYDTQELTSSITDETLSKIKENPERWALVMFDCHF